MFRSEFPEGELLQEAAMASGTDSQEPQAQRYKDRWAVAFTGGVLALAALASCAVHEIEPGEPGVPSAAPADAASEPLGTPPPPPAGEGGYRPLFVHSDDPTSLVRWEPCRPIHYVINAKGAPESGIPALNDAISSIEEATGFNFVYDGETTEEASVNRPKMDEKRYGDRWSPVLIDWVDPDEYPPMKGYAGLGGPQMVQRSDKRWVYITGVVYLNQENLSQVETWPQGTERVEAVTRHELGHLVGLDHVDDSDQVMFKKPTLPPNELGDGDRRGLARLGVGKCYPNEP
jgi:hypothetical protein